MWRDLGRITGSKGNTVSISPAHSNPRRPAGISDLNLHPLRPPLAAGFLGARGWGREGGRNIDASRPSAPEMQLREGKGFHTQVRTIQWGVQQRWGETFQGLDWKGMGPLFPPPIWTLESLLGSCCLNLGPLRYPPALPSPKSCLHHLSRLVLSLCPTPA